MKCPFCSCANDRVVDSRESVESTSIRRRRECLECHRRFTTYEKIEAITLKVVKRDNTREDYDRHKLLSGILKACEKRPIGIDQIDCIVDEIEREIEKRNEQEVASKDIGEMVMRHLHTIDEVAYVRFASVYRQFKDVNEFMDVIKKLLEH